MNIYEWAEDFNYNADYSEPARGTIYLVQEYGRKLKELKELEKCSEEVNEEHLMLLREEVNRGIKVMQDGQFIGYARR